MASKYKSLVSNTLIFAIGSFGSKLMVFFLLPLYTNILSQTEYGAASLVADTANMIIPLITIGITNAVIRYGLDKSVKKTDVFTVGMAVTMGGFAVFLVLFPVVSLFSVIRPYVILLYLYVLMSSMNSLCAQFVRARGQVRLYAIDGIFNTVCLIGLNLLLLLVFRLGVVGYILSTILADLLSVLFLFISANLKRYLNFHAFNGPLFKKMVFFALPMVPNSFFWWITNLSDRYIVTAMIGLDANGLYAAAYKIPTAITMISAIFTQAWQMSAISEYGDKSDRKFYATVFSIYQMVVFLSAGLLILVIKPVTSILLDVKFYESWQYVPFLVMSVVFSCFSGFYSSIYMAAKRNVRSMVTTFLGAAINVGLNFVLIPLMGVQGAALSTFISYLVVYLARVVDVRGIYPFKGSFGRVTVNTLLLLGQTLTLLYLPSHALSAGVLLFAALVLMNLRQLLFLVFKFTGAVKARFKQRKIKQGD